MRERMPADTAPLAGIMVLELGQIYNAPYAGLLLAGAGADVIKIEPPRGDPLRVRGGGTGYHFAMLNANKRGVTLNLKDPRGRALFLRMVDRADVVTENFSPGVMERLELSPESLLERNPRLVYASGSGFGRDGAYAKRRALDLAVQAFAGVMSITGAPGAKPVRAGAAIADFLGGVHLYAAIATALFERERTGCGRVVHVAMLDALLPALTSAFATYYETGVPPAPQGNRHSSIAPYDAYECEDGWIVVLCGTDEHWARLCGAIRRPELVDDARFSTDEQRVAHCDEVDAIVGAWTGGRTRARALEELEVRGVVCSPVRGVDEVITDEVLHERGTLRATHHPRLGPLTIPMSPLRSLHESDGALEPSPDLGEDNEGIYCGWLGVAESELRQLVVEGVV